MLRKFTVLSITAIFIFISGCAKSPVKKDIIKKQKLHPPLKFLILGDSLIGGFIGLMMTRELNRYPGISARRFYYKSTGLSEYHRYNWPGKTIQYIKTYKPDILVVLFGANDSWAVRLNTGKLVFHWQPEFWDLYAQRVREYLRTVLPHVKKVYWIAQPATSHHSFAPRYRKLNVIYKEECGKFVNAKYIPAWEWTSKDGEFTPYLTDKRGRTGYSKRIDKIHFSPFGGMVITEKFVDFIRDDIDFP